MHRIAESEIDALEAILDTWSSGEPEAIGWAATLCDGIASRFEEQLPPTGIEERAAALRLVAMAAGALPKLKEEAAHAKSAGDAIRSRTLEAAGARLESFARMLVAREESEEAT